MFVEIDRASFLNVSRWVEYVRSERGEEIVIVLVGNKSDLGDRRQVSLDEGEDKARAEQVLYWRYFYEIFASIFYCFSSHR